MDRGIDAHGAGKASAVTAAQEERAFVRGEKEPSHCERCRRLAGATDGRIAEADHRHASAATLPTHAERRHRAIDARERAEQAAAAGPPPKGGLSHQCMIPNKLAPDLIRGGNRFPEKIMATF
jgi:hypothetical protein